ncbi:EGF-like domain-containing protein 2 [Haliotis rubra]|uniref:EGF-like domain-containing protein 2 n=1 Tax=Haliotis rubra TaxID=36100 RepID=UPI001EE56081|nr:EGF-like domain-containing protein 2 [Haliotis rubra]
MSLMSTQHNVLLTVAIIVTLSAIATASFDCRRKGQECFNSGTCQPNGTCSCTADYDGYNCRIQNSGRAANSCKPACLNSGVCANNTCFCMENYYGANCNNKREEILCFGDRKAIHINPEGFQGTIYIVGKRGMANCTFKNVTDVISSIPQNVTWSEGLAIVIPDNSTECGNIAERTEGTTLIEERFASIEYEPLIVTTLDERLAAMCKFDNSTNRTLYGDVVSSSVTNAQYTNTSITNIYEPVVFKVMSNNQPLSNKPMLIGQELTFSFNIPVETGYVAVAVETLTANDTKAGGSTFVIITSKCPATDADSVLSTFERSSDNRIVTVIVKVFKFVDSDSVGFTCNARICKAGDPACDLPTCNGQASPSTTGRRKRDVGNQKTIQTVVKVTEDPQAAAAAGQSPTDKTPDECKNDSSKQAGENECLMKKEIIVVLAIMAATVIILMIACMVMTCKLLKAGTKVVDVPQSEYQPSMSLPRLSPANF